MIYDMTYKYIRASTIVHRAIKMYERRMQNKSQLYFDPYSLRLSVVLRDTIQELCGDAYYSMESFYNTKIYKKFTQLFCTADGQFDENDQFGPPNEHNIDGRYFALKQMFLPFIKRGDFMCIVDTHRF